MSAPNMFQDFESSQRELLPRFSLSSRRSFSTTRSNSRAEALQEHRPLSTGRDHEPSDESVAASENEYELGNLSEPPAATGIILLKAAPLPPEKTPSTNDTESGQKKDQENVFWVWKEELLLLLGAALLFGGICLILYMYDEGELPNWDNLGITLNTLISIIATMFRASLAIITFEILAQLKWDWISSGSFRPMQQVQIFDSASRGILGCLRLIPVIAIQHPLALAAIFVTVSSIGIGSFTQQSVQTFQCRLPMSSPNHHATINTANSVDPSDWGRFSGVFQLDMKLKLAMKDAILTSREYSSLFSCPSGNCTFPTYSNGGGYSRSNQTSHASVGLCSRCSDIKDIIRGPEPLNSSSWPENSTVVYSLPDLGRNDGDKRMEIITWPVSDKNNVILNSRMEDDIGWAREALDDEFLNRARWAIANITILGASEDGCVIHDNDTLTCHEACNEETESTDSCRYSNFLHQYMSGTNVAAALCTLYPCIKYFTAEVNDGKLQEKVEWDIPLYRQRSETQTFFDGPEWQGIMQPCLVNDTIYTSENASSPLSKIPNPAPVLFHVDDWATESPKSLAQFVNVTVPADCIVKLPDAITRVLETEFRVTYNTTCSIHNVNSAGYTMIKCEQYDDNEVLSESHLAALLTNGKTSMSTINKAMNSIATRLTNEIREVGKGPFGAARPDVKGLVWEMRACVHIEWYWLIFPGALLVMCAILLATIMVTDARKKYVWKSSILPFLLKDHPGIHNMSMKGVAKVADSYQLKMETKSTA